MTDKGEEGKREGMARAHRAANPVWKAFMQIGIVEIAKVKEFLTTNDLEDRRKELNGPVTHNKVAIGSLMRQAAKDGVIAKTSRMVESTEASSHKRPKRQWQSLIYQGQP
jgi:hypothetical protein